MMTKPNLTIHSISLSSVVGVGDTDLGLLSLGDLGRRGRVTQPHTIQFNDAAYLVGEGLTRFARPVERMDLQRLGDGPEARALTYATLGLLLGPGIHFASLMVGLPVEVMADRGVARQRCPPCADGRYEALWENCQRRTPPLADS